MDLVFMAAGAVLLGIGFNLGWRLAHAKQELPVPTPAHDVPGRVVVLDALDDAS